VKSERPDHRWLGIAGRSHQEPLEIRHQTQLRPGRIDNYQKYQRHCRWQDSANHHQPPHHKNKRKVYRRPGCGHHGTFLHEVCSHGYRWEEVFRLSREEERDHLLRAIDSFVKTTGSRPVGWYCRFGPSVHTRELVVEEGGFIYDSDAYNDDLPYFMDVGGKQHLIVPYTPDNNDFRFWSTPGFVTGDHFQSYLTDAFDTLYAESATCPKMMSIGLHARMIGRPGRLPGLRRFIEYAKSHDDVWFATREEIARHWLANAR